MTNIKALREDAGLTVHQLGQFLDISPEETEEIENGNKPMTTVQLDKLCCLFRCSEEYILGLADGQTPQINMNGLSAEEMTAVANIGRICNNIQLLEKLLTGKKGRY